jgi:hypothetical protein
VTLGDKNVCIEADFSKPNQSAFCLVTGFDDVEVVTDMRRRCSSCQMEPKWYLFTNLLIYSFKNLFVLKINDVTQVSDHGASYHIRYYNR